MKHGVNKTLNKKIASFLVTILIILILVAVVYLFKAKKQDLSTSDRSIYYNSGYSSVSEETPNSFDSSYFVFLEPFPNSTPVFELSKESADKKNIWNFIKNNFKLTSESTINEDIVAGLPFIVKNNQSKYRFNISGFFIGVDEIQSGQERISAVKKIEQEIINLGYKSELKNNEFEIVGEDSFYTEFFIKGDQAFSLFYNQDDCAGQWGGCGISINYSNNINQQIKSQQIIFNKLSSSISTHPTLNELIKYNAYFENNQNSITIDKYKIFIIGHYNSDVWTFLTEEKEDGALDIIAISPSENKIEYDQSIIDKLPIKILCAFESANYDGIDSDIAKECSKYMKPYFSPRY